MSTPLLRTKLYVPAPLPAQRLVPRLRLVHRLDEGLRLGRTLTLVSAPAGFGKTTLLSEWVAECGRPVTWISLDEADNDQTRFLAYVVAALQTIPDLSEAGVGGAAAAALQSPRFVDADTSPSIEPLLTGLINEIADVSDSFILVLDDFHVITAPQVNEAIAFLLDNLPPQMHLVLSSRVDPPLALARLRARGEMTELRADDLRFTPEETATFLNGVMKLDLSPEDVAALETRTEGWIAGLQMAALSMRGREDVSGFIRAFSGSHRFILDYLMEEVLEQQSRDVQEFLLKTSILGRMTAPLCDAVRFGFSESPPSAEGTAIMDGSDSRTILNQLDQANLFLVPLDDERNWYRYHHLFADLLRQNLREECADLAPTLHRRASEWYETRELHPDAVSHSLAAGDEERAAELIGREGWDMLVRGEMRELLGWLSSLPQDLVNSRPQLGVIHAWALALTSQWERLEQRLTRIGDGHVPGEIAALQAYVASVQANVPRTVALCKQASEALPEREWFSRSFVALSLGIVYLADRQPAPARKAFCEAIELCRATGFSYMMQAAMMELGFVQQMAGSLHEAVETFHRALELIPGQDLRPVPIAGMAYLGLSKAHYEWNDLDRALQNARRGIEVTDLGGFTNALLDSYVRLIEAHLARGDMMAASQAFEKAERLVKRYPHPAIPGMLAILRVRFWLRSGDLAAASLWLQEHPPAAGGATNYPQELEQLAAARVLLGLKQTTRVLELLRPLQDRAEEAGRVWMLIRILVLQARALQVEENWGQAVSTLGRALSLAEPEGYVRTFVDEGEPMARLLRRALTQGVAPDYVARLLAGQGTEGGGVWSNGAAPTLRYLEVSGNIGGLGGGVMLRGGAGRLEQSRVTDNRAVDGGGVCLIQSSATVFSNTIQGNTATGGFGGGGGLYLGESNAAVMSSTISGNAVIGNLGGGGGLYLDASHGATLSGNDIRDNSAMDNGGGVSVDTSHNVTLVGNTIQRNAVDEGSGGGLDLYSSDQITLSHNAFLSNTAWWDGGGVHLSYSNDSFVKDNVIRGNVSGMEGGGIQIYGSDNATAINNVVVGNQAGPSHYGSGICVEGSTPVYLLHTTIHDNTGGDGSGVYVTDAFGDYSDVWLTNTIVASQTVGVGLDFANAAYVNGVLWFGNGTDTVGSVAVENDHDGPPAFAADGYHLTGGSDAIDRGVGMAVASDIDGQRRTFCAGPDLGADEYPWGVAPTGVSIAGPTTGVTDTTYAFTATVGPITATTPVTYTWAATDHSLQIHTGVGLSDTVAFDWGLVGVKTVTVTVVNPCGSRSGVLDVDIRGDDEYIYLPLVLRNQ